MPINHLPPSLFFGFQGTGSKTVLLFDSSISSYSLCDALGETASECDQSLSKRFFLNTGVLSDDFCRATRLFFGGKVAQGLSVNGLSKSDSSDCFEPYPELYGETDPGLKVRSLLSLSIRLLVGLTGNRNTVLRGGKLNTEGRQVCEVVVKVIFEVADVVVVALGNPTPVANTDIAIAADKRASSSNTDISDVDFNSAAYNSKSSTPRRRDDSIWRWLRSKHACFRS